MNPLYTLLTNEFNTQQKIANAFQVSRQAVSKWKRDGVPENIALLCHLDPSIPYTYDPSHFGRKVKGLDLNLTKPTS